MVALDIPTSVASAMAQISNNPTVTLFIIVFVCLVVGTFMNAQPAILILAPIFFPITTDLGIDPIFFGIVMSMALVIGVITPPVGVDLFVASSIAKLSLESVSKATFPYVLVLIFDVVLVILFPDIAMFVFEIFE